MSHGRMPNMVHDRGPKSTHYALFALCNSKKDSVQRTASCLAASTYGPRQCPIVFHAHTVAVARIVSCIPVACGLLVSAERARSRPPAAPLLHTAVALARHPVLPVHTLNTQYTTEL